ncbi:MAG: SIS domain-containing protein [Acidobacteriota bacterium]
MAAVIVSNDTERATSLTNSQDIAKQPEDNHPQTANGVSELSETTAVNHQSRAALEVENFFTLAVDELTALRTRAEFVSIETAAELILHQETFGGRVHVTGIGKSEHVARYAASLLSSTGTPAYFLHATECVHGSAGQVRKEDVLIAISNSGETPELIHAVEVLKEFGVKIICVSGQPESHLAKLSTVVLNAGVENEGGTLNLVPRASILAKIFVLCGLSVSLETHKGLTREQYAQWHPSGALGRIARGE